VISGHSHWYANSLSMPELLDVAEVFLSSTGVSRGKLISNIAQILELDNINSTAVQDTSSYLTDGFYDFPVDKPLNPERNYQAPCTPTQNGRRNFQSSQRFRLST
jgi:hypothetical protein